MAKSKRKCRIVTDPIYRADVFFMLGGTAKELREYFINIHGSAPDFDDTTAGLQHSAILKKKENYCFYLWLEKLEAGNLVHECDHLASDVLRLAGIEINQRTEEAHAYLLEYYFRRGWNVFKNMKKGVRNA